MTALIDPIALSIVATGALVGICGALLGTFLVLRGSAMQADAISHAILFGIVMVWLVTHRTSGPVQIAGAALAGLLSVLLSELLARTRLVATDAAIGLVFPALFAAGVLLINIHARDVHIDAHAVLLGEIGFVWLETVEVAGVELARSLVTLAVMLAIDLAFVLACWKELKLATFDPALAAALGFAPGFLAHLLLGLTSATAVAAFDAVGVVLFLAFVIVPPATAFLLTERLSRMLALAVALAVAASLAGYPLAVAWDVSIGGSMASVTGGFFALALVFAPRRGLLAEALRRRAQRLDNACRTLVAHLATHADAAAAAEENTARALREHLRWSDSEARRVILRGLDRGLIHREGGRLALTEKGAAEAQALFAPPV